MNTSLLRFALPSLNHHNKHLQQVCRSKLHHIGYHTTPSMNVPTIAQVRPGASVSIVLKADQRTGREVTGQVQDVLTRGNHPRGIKVRLQDGRIGRVQRMLVSGSQPGIEVSEGNYLLHGAAEPQEHTSNTNRGNRHHGTAVNHRLYVRDVRLDEHLEPSAEQIDLMAYVKPAKQPKGRRQRKTTISSIEDAEVSCPVCGSFKGDEAAVAHHVETHFDKS